MRDILEVASQLQDFLAKRRWRFAFIGGLANLAWGEIRTTRDVDLTLFTSFVDEVAFVDELLEAYKARSSDARRFALQARVLLLQSQDGIGIDIGLAGFPYEELAIERSVDVDYGDGIALHVITAEDLIVMKTFAGRDQDWADVLGIVRRQGAKLDWDHIIPHADELAHIKEDENSVPRLLAIRSRFDT